MNWFERYGIAGMFFIIMTGIWFFSLFPDSFIPLSTLVIKNKGLASFIVGLCTIGFLPIGYLIAIFGQYLYYSKRCGVHVHCDYWKTLSPETKEEIKKEEKSNYKIELTEEDEENEAKLESILTYYDRTKFKDVKRNEFLSSFATKRYDVIAISRSLGLASIISGVLALCIKLIIWAYGYYKYLLFWMILITSILVLDVLQKSTAILETQIIELGKRKLNEKVWKTGESESQKS